MRVIAIDLDDPHLAPLRTWLRTLKEARIEHELERCNGSHKRVAQILGVDRSTVWRAARGCGRIALTAMSLFGESERQILNDLKQGQALILSKLEKIMATETDLANGIATIKTDLDAVGAGITAVQTALAGLAAGTVTQAELDQAVADLAAAHTSAQASVAALGTIAANP